MRKWSHFLAYARLPASWLWGCKTQDGARRNGERRGRGHGKREPRHIRGNCAFLSTVHFPADSILLGGTSILYQLPIEPLCSQKDNSTEGWAPKVRTVEQCTEWPSWDAVPQQPEHLTSPEARAEEAPSLLFSPWLFVFL